MIIMIVCSLRAPALVSRSRSDSAGEAEGLNYRVMLNSISSAAIPLENGKNQTQQNRCAPVAAIVVNSHATFQEHAGPCKWAFWAVHSTVARHRSPPTAEIPLRSQCQFTC